MSLRPYQIDSIREIREQFAAGNRKVLLWAATGSGKSVVACEIIKSAVLRGKRVIFVVRGVSLIDQISRRLFQEKVEHGVRQASHWNKNRQANTMVCSIDTIARRKDYPPADLIIIDEADQATSNSYKDFVEHYPNSFIMGITATPFSDRGLNHIADVVVHPVSVKDLTEQGYLSPLRYFAPSAPDLEGVKIDSKTHDFQNTQLEERMNTGKLTGDILTHWLQIGGGRPTLLFAVNVRHSKMLTAMFNDNGVPAEHVDAKTPQGERDLVFARLKSGATKIVCNVGIATRGIDLPFVSCLIMARPTHSYCLYIQCLGRGTRVAEGKVDTIVLDHAGNTVRHGFMVNEPPCDLMGPPERDKKVREIKICEKCFLAFVGNACPDCGTKVKEPVNIEIEAGSLKEVASNDSIEILQYAEHCKRIQRNKGYKYGWVWHQVVKKFGWEASQPFLPLWFKRSDEDEIFGFSPYRPVNVE